ncbi:MAG: hypothetical protein COB02_17420 [Candidatus Cloacimonadota bacterium]|nr:MAG: hypothetical protein COB02_17420 [Candidatus Cloacimonadota bacterium]
MHKIRHQIMSAFFLTQSCFSYTDLNYLFIRANSFEKQNNFKKALNLYRQVLKSDTPEKYKKFAANKILKLDNKNTLETNLSNLIELNNMNCMFLSDSKSLSFVWEGSCKNGLISGSGKLFQLDKTKTKFLIFNGKMLNGQKDSFGLSYRKDKSLIYMGMFKNNQYHGEGKLHYKTGDIAYSGSFINGQKEGHSKSFRPNGAMLYIGEYKNNQFDGNGITYFEDGEIYQGIVKNSYRHGEGLFTLAEGLKIQGNWLNGALSSPITSSTTMSEELLDYDSTIETKVLSNEIVLTQNKF